MPKNLPITGNRAQCPTCRECFNSDSAFDRHRVGSYDDPKNRRRCLTTEQMVSKGFKTNAKGYWIRGKRPKGIVHGKAVTPVASATTVPGVPAVAL